MDRRSPAARRLLIVAGVGVLVTLGCRSALEATEPARANSSGPTPIEGRIAHLPSIRSLAIEATSSGPVEKYVALALWVTDAEGKRTLLNQPLAAGEWKPTPRGVRHLRRVVNLPALDEGTYRSGLKWPQPIRDRKSVV